MTAAAAATAPSTSTITFTVGNDVTWTVPAWTTTVHVEAAGGGGSTGQSTSTSRGGYGAPGSIVSADITVTPGEPLVVYVGGAASDSAGGTSRLAPGGRGGQGDLGAPVASGGNGGGASFVLQNGVPIVVAGGGGGGGGASPSDAVSGHDGGLGGAGGGFAGSPGVGSYHGDGGRGFSTGAAGAVGASAAFLTAGGGGGGGGGGWRPAGGGGGLGGGAPSSVIYSSGSAGGGAGGASYAADPYAVITTNPSWDDGSVVLTWTPVLPTKIALIPTANPAALGTPVSFVAQLSWDPTANLPPATGWVTFGTFDPYTGVELPQAYWDLSGFTDPTSVAVDWANVVFPLGSTYVWVSYSGDANHAPAKTSYYNEVIEPVRQTVAPLPSSVDFGPADLGSSLTRTVTFTNTGNVGWQPQRTSVTGSSFSLVNSTCLAETVAPGASCAATLRFTPSAGGPTSGSFDVTDAAGGTTTVTLTGAIAQRSIVVSPKAVTFQSTNVGRTRTQTVTITNTGNIDWRALSISTSRPEFLVDVQSCEPAALVLAGQSCSFLVSFAPSATGSFSGTATIADDWGRTTTMVLSGTSGVVAPTIVGITPVKGPKSGGTTVKITGTNLVGVTAISFGGVAALQFTCSTPTKCSAVSPASPTGRGTVDVQVSTPGGTSPAVTADRFTYR